MMIYHYTTIESLAMILKSKRLLFNRLDFVDDIEEGTVESSGIMVGKYIFVSCWTETPDESIPLWRMYARDNMGVRIGLEKDMFKKYLYQNPIFGGRQWKGSMYLPISEDKMQDPNYFVLPEFDINRGNFYRKIQYVDDVKGITKNCVRINNTGDKVEAQIAFGEIGRYKHLRWQFQEESRFVLTIFPFNPLFESDSEIGTIAINSYLQNKPIGFKQYYLDLDENVLNRIEITLSPCALEGQRVIVEALTKLYAPQASVKSSSLGQLVRFP